MDPIIAREAEEIEDRGLPGTHDKTVYQDTLALWRRAPNWHTLTELNRRYLESRLTICPSYDEPVAEETDGFSGILELHDYGALSTSSSPASKNEHSEQRAYLFFNLPTRDLRSTSPVALSNFVQALVASTEVYAHVRFQYNNPPDNQRDPIISGLMQFGSFSNLPNIDDDVWKEEGWSCDKDDLGQAVTLNFEQARYLSDHSNTGDYRIQTCGSIFRDDEAPIAASHRADPLQISVVAKDWKYNEIGELVKNLMVQAGIQPAYRR